MTDEELAAIRERAEKATAGPWGAYTVPGMNRSSDGYSAVEIAEAVLSAFHYEDWSIGDDGVLRLGDYVCLVEENRVTSTLTLVYAQIGSYRDESCGVGPIPVFMVPDREADDWTCWSILDTALRGYWFERVTEEEFRRNVGEEQS